MTSTCKRIGVTGAAISKESSCKSGKGKNYEHDAADSDWFLSTASDWFTLTNQMPTTNTCQTIFDWSNQIWHVCSKSRVTGADAQVPVPN